MKIKFNILLFLFLTATTFSQSKDSTKINYTKLSFLSGGTIGFFTYGYVIQNNIWWKGDKTNFHFNNSQDYKYALNADKLGHFYFGYLASNIYSDLFQWTGIKKENASIYGGLIAFSFHTFTEVRDGFSKDYGFSWGDLLADILGASYPILQSKFVPLKSFTFKVSFFPSQKYKDGAYSHILDDYESTFHWLSIDINKILPTRIKRFNPDFVNIAVGHSVNNLDLNGKGNHELYLSLDWDFESLPGNNSFWKIIKRNLNYYHFPSPAIKIYPNIVWYGIKF